MTFTVSASLVSSEPTTFDSFTSGIVFVLELQVVWFSQVLHHHVEPSLFDGLVETDVCPRLLEANFVLASELFPKHLCGQCWMNRKVLHCFAWQRWRHLVESLLQIQRGTRSCISFLHSRAREHRSFSAVEISFADPHLVPKICCLDTVH